MGTSREERRRQWAEWLEKWRGSGQSKAAFCREHSLNTWQFYDWSRRLGRAEVAASSGGFAQVQSGGGSGVVLRVAGGLDLELQPGFDESTLVRVLRTLGAAC